MTRSTFAGAASWTLLYGLLLLALFVSPINKPHHRAGYLREDLPSAARGLLLQDALNVAVFVPLGFGLHRIARREGMRSPLLGAGIVAGVFSLTIETIQFFLPYRYSSVIDIVANTLGGFLGAWIEARTAALRQ